MLSCNPIAPLVFRLNYRYKFSKKLINLQTLCTSFHVNSLQFINSLPLLRPAPPQNSQNSQKNLLDINTNM